MTLIRENFFEKKLLEYDKKVLSVGFLEDLLEKGIDDFKSIVRDAYEHNVEIKFYIGGSM